MQPSMSFKVCEYPESKLGDVVIDLKFEIGEKITFLWVIDFIWLKELFFYALYANKFRDLKASNGLAHIFFINCATQASFVRKKMDDEIFQVLATRVHVYMH